MSTLSKDKNLGFIKAFDEEYLRIVDMYSPEQLGVYMLAFQVGWEKAMEKNQEGESYGE